MHQRIIIITTAVLAVLWLQPAEAKRKLVFDEEHGIVFVDDKQPAQKQRLTKQRTTAPRETTEVEMVKKTVTVKAGELLQNQKSTPETFYQTGLHFYRNKDFEEALRFFTKAFEIGRKSEYNFWMGLCHRSLGDTAVMVSIFEDILEKQPQSTVADDCVFYIAFYYQISRDYEMAIRRYKDLIEFYPDGVSAVNYTEFRDRARRCIASIKINVISMLSGLGYTEETMAGNLRRFQVDRSLPVTGVMDRRTMNMLVATFSSLEDDALKQTENRQGNTKRRIVFLGVFGTAFALNIIWGLALVSLVRHRLEQVDAIVKYNLKY
jgi:TolA-binding protein